MERPNMSIEPRNELEASRSLGGGSTDMELLNASMLSGTHDGDDVTAGHRVNMQMAGGIAEGVSAGSEQFLDPSMVIPEKYAPIESSEVIPQIELMHFDFDTPSIEEVSTLGDAANEDDVREAA